MAGERRAGTTAALIAVKGLHSAIFFSVQACVGYLIYAEVTQRLDRRTAIAACIVAAESAVFLGNHMVCPLTTVAERLGTDSGSVTDIYLPDWLAKHIFLLNAPLVGLVLCLHLRGRLRARATARGNLSPRPDGGPWGTSSAAPPGSVSHGLFRRARRSVRAWW